MHTIPLKLLTIIGESVLEDRLVRFLRDHGARGYTAYDVRGEGSRGVRSAHPDERNVKITTVVSPQVADAILEALAREYFPFYAVIAYVEEVHVVRGEKYI
jgi:nitrogen regulatory protein P-II 2